MLEAQAILTLAFNIVCIGYTTLMAANFVAGLVEQWMMNRTREQLPEVLDHVNMDENRQELEPVVVEEEMTIPFGWDVIEPYDHVYYDIDNLHYTIRELKAMAKERHIRKYSYMTKKELIAVLFE